VLQVHHCENQYLKIKKLKAREKKGQELSVNVPVAQTIQGK